MLITIFTPTYNRAYTLHRLYESLCSQTDKDFEWIIVDDGSTDDTRELVLSWINEKKILIRYYYQQNSGKPSAHNKGVQEARGELFTCVDSDDYLRSETVEIIINEWNQRKQKGIIGIVAFRVYCDDTPVTSIKNKSITFSTLREAYKKYGLSGDTMLIYDINVLRQISFPCIEGEKFIPEGYLYNKLDKKGKMYILQKGLYVCEYLDDGYTRNVAKNLYNNYRGYVLHINERIKETDENIWEKFLDSIRYDSIMIAHHEKKIIRHAEIPALALIGFLPAYIIAHRRYGSFMKRG